VGIDRVVGARSQLSGHPLARQRMNIFTRLLGGVPKDDRGGIRLAEPQPWEVSPTKDVERFLRALPLLAPVGTNVYFEGTGEAHVAKYLEGVAIEPPVQVAVGIIWPKPDCYHVPLTQATMGDLVSFLGRRPAGYFCTHCHVYRDRSMLLEWHDAFGTDPMYVSRTIEDSDLERFVAAIGGSCTSRRAG